MKFVNYDIVFQEIPDETTLAINISNCPCACKGCHSDYLQKDIGQVLDEPALACLLKKYAKNITCVAFMGGDANVNEVVACAKWVKEHYQLKTAWYSGRTNMSDKFLPIYFDYLKLGPYKEQFGNLTKKTTNQRLFKILKMNSNQLN